ncbi:4-hydroxy-tetrahydrodipicolinate synthase [Pokkaliibacter plantistimulans]|uniref:4-hydroxy-tetrahydrodipicolinate synthase n=1 Tax=Proteobacteria bacterium 228 TaxID=2083153 RepID=A0A2S5KNK1_9PROT|nr:4-hydroxy-tetrahydrodipicolinate synthase [Pokkaliibacter plantistimulans]PPC76368.1 4-hydroxy-tetrahydrodipicolinate synthase [Pokkaliibacter plantistimulans]
MIKGSLVALVTPMTSMGDVDWAMLDRLVELHIEAGTSAIVAVGTTGESATLDNDEHLAVISRVVQRSGGRMHVMAGTGANATSEAVALTRAAAHAGADSCLSVVPYYNKPTQEGLYQHFSAIAAAVDIDLYLYNVPGRTVCDMLPETVVRLAKDVPNIVGLKDATGNLERARWLLEHLPEGFALYSGDDATALDLILLGGQGNISVTANVAPALMADMCRLALQGNVNEARIINERLMPLHQNLFVESNPIPVKWAMAELDMIQTGIRLPLTTLSNQYHDLVRQALAHAGLI